MSYALVDETLVERLSDEQERLRWLILEHHPDFDGQWLVQSFDPGMFFLLGDFIGPYRAVAPARLQEFLTAAEIAEYKVAFFDDPTDILASYEGLNEPPEFAIDSDLANTVQGLLPFQIQGFNFLREQEGGVAMWSTGTGKTVLASALIKHHLEHQSFDLCWFVVKSHNKVNTQRTLKRLAGLESLVVSGDKKVRQRTYAGLADVDQPTIVVTNYEKFRVDHEEMLPLFEKSRVMVVWDEMPTKLKNRSSKLYKAVCRCLYRTAPPQVSYDRRRPAELRQYMLSATPIENDPEDWFNCIRLIDPRVYGTVEDFRTEFVTRFNFFDRNKPEVWHRLDRMGLKAAHMVHQADKVDPDIAAQFPKVLEEVYYVDWDDGDRKIYDLLTTKAEEIDMEKINVLALISVLQMLCDAPSMLLNSATVRAAYNTALEAWIEDGGKMPSVEGSEAALRLVESVGHLITDERHTKLETLRSLICEAHPDEKVVVFSAYNDGLLPILGAKFEAWGVPFVRYSGSQGVRQKAQDSFLNDPDIRVFLSSDAGSDSINLAEASVVIHYDLPWKWATYIQRQNRIHRVTSTFDTVRFYTLLMADSVEDRKLAIIMRKMGYHLGVFKGAIADASASARMTRGDLLYILTGRQ